MRVKLKVELAVADVSDARKALVLLADGLAQMDMTSLRDWAAAGPIIISVPDPDQKGDRRDERAGTFDLTRVF